MFEERRDLRDFLAAILRQPPEALERNRQWVRLQAFRLSIPTEVIEAAEQAANEHGPMGGWASRKGAEQIMKRHRESLTEEARSRWKRQKMLAPAEIGT